MQKPYFRFLLVVVLALVVGQLPLVAQGTDGAISGVVSDETGAVIPGAEVNVVNQGTGQEFLNISGDSGSYRFPALTPGLYTLRASMTGFQTFVARDIKVDVGKTYTQNARLEVGAITSEIIVSAGAELIERTEAKVASTIGKLEIDKLPVNGRNPIRLMRLMAGVSDNNAPGTGLVIAGNRTSYTNISMDGVNIQDNFIRSNSTTFVPARPTMDSVGEFTIVTQNQGVESGFGSNQVQVVTPSGTNDIHGNVYWYHRNSATAANDFFNNRAGIEKEFLIRHQFGVSGSGPIIKDKLLVWGNYEGQRVAEGSANTATVALADIRNGIFKYNKADGSGVGSVNLFDLSGLSLDSAMATTLQAAPSTGNDSGLVTDNLNLSGLRFNQASDNRRNQTKFRVDYIVNDAHSIEGTYQFLENSDLRDGIDGTPNKIPVVTSGTGDEFSDFFSFAWKWSATPTFLNEVRFGGFLSPVLFAPDGGGIAEPKALAQGFTLTSLFFTNPIEDFERQGRITNTYTWQDNASWQKGAHSLRFGFQSNLIRVNSFACFTCLPEHSLGISNDNDRIDLDTTLFPGGISDTERNRAEGYLADLSGMLNSGTQEWNVTSRQGTFEPVSDDFNWEYDTYSFYFGDNWRVSPRLTLNLGVRWELTPNLKEKNDLLVQAGFSGDRSTVGLRKQLLNPNAVWDFVTPTPLIDSDNNNFAPNVGFAWDMFGDGRTTLRAGYSISYVNDEAIRSTDTWLNREGLNANTTVANLSNTIGEGLPSFTAPDFELPLDQSTIVARNGNRPAGIFGIPNDLVVPYVQTWNLSIGREVGWDTAVEVRYVGTKGTSLRRGIDVNQVGTGSADWLVTGAFQDFLNARNNGFLAFEQTGLFRPAFNPDIVGSVPLPFFDTLSRAGNLNGSTNRGRIQRGEAGQLIWDYLNDGRHNDANISPNNAADLADLAVNQASSTYHGASVDVRRRFKSGLLFNANYTFSKVFTDAAGGGQTSFEPFIDINNPGYERSRAQFDLTHGFNAHFVYQLPFGSGRGTEFDSGWLNAIVGGWDLSSIFAWQSGEPVTFQSARGTLNRSGRSGPNTANSALSFSELRDLLGIFESGGRILSVNPSVIGSDGRAVNNELSPEFAGQVFHNPEPGELGGLPNRGWNGPQFFNWDFRVAKVFDVGNVGFTENLNVEFQADFFNLVNNHTFNVDGTLNINSTGFGNITSTLGSPRIIQFALRFNW